MNHDVAEPLLPEKPTNSLKYKRKSASRYCSVPQCKNKASNGISFHKFPSGNLLRQWVRTLKIVKKVTKAMFVCSDHFNKDDFFYFDASLSQRKRLKSTAVPSCKLPLLSTARKQTTQKVTAKAKRASRATERTSAKLLSSRPIQRWCTENCTAEEHPGREGLTNGASSSDEENTIVAAEALLELHNAFAVEEAQSTEPEKKMYVDAAYQVSTYMLNPLQNVTLATLIKTNSDLSAFTGIATLKQLDSICQAAQLLESSEHFTKPYLRLDITERIILTLVKLKLNISFKCISVLFQISITTCIRYFHLTLQLLSSIMEEAIEWTSKEDILNNMPTCFAKYKETRVVLDCTETPVKKPSCLSCRILTYSFYKGCNTIKFLIGVAPDGLITYCSLAYGGRASDKAIFMQSDLFEKLDPHSDAIMADKGFLIEHECLMNGIKLIRPPFLGKAKQFSEAEGLLTADIAQARIHVERSIQRIKNFKIVKNQLQWNLVPYINDIIRTIVGIVNLSNPILAMDKFKVHT